MKPKPTCLRLESDKDASVWIEFNWAVLVRGGETTIIRLDDYTIQQMIDKID